MIRLLCLLLLSASAAAQVSVIDYQGREIVLEQAAQRVIGMSPHVVENLYSAGAGERMVGVTSYSNFPEAALKLPIVGDYSSTNYELITELNPDLIVLWNSGRHLEVAEKLRELGFVVYVDDPHKLEDVERSIRDMAVLMGTTEEAEVATQQFLQRLAKMRQQYADRSDVRVLYQVWMDPLQTLNGNHIISDVIRLCGGRNVFAEEESLAPKINIEAVIARNPEAIVSGGMATKQQEWLSAWQRWPVIDAVKKKHVYGIEPDIISRHTVRLLDGAQAMCEHLEKVRLYQGTEVEIKADFK